MTSPRDALIDHLNSGVTTVCRAWKVVRSDGRIFGFTDHDEELRFGGVTFKASTGLSARALQQSTGLSVDNSEAAGALSDAAIDEADIAAGRFDDAEVRVWLVNWADPSQRIEQFCGNFGDISRAGNAFKVELRGMTERLNQPLGRVFQRGCSALLGDEACGLDLMTPAVMAEATVTTLDGSGRMTIETAQAFSDGWFERGHLSVLTGAAQGLSGLIKFDRATGNARTLELWVGALTGVAIGDQVRIVAGCDKRAETCRSKFDNFLNFRGFPHIPGEDWLASYPVRSKPNDGGSLGR